jgi:hypothetical protein
MGSFSFRVPYDCFSCKSSLQSLFSLVSSENIFLVIFQDHNLELPRALVLSTMPNTHRFLRRTEAALRRIYSCSKNGLLKLGSGAQASAMWMMALSGE